MYIGVGASSTQCTISQSAVNVLATLKPGMALYDNLRALVCLLVPVTEPLAVDASIPAFAADVV